jgi:hypothetical protein
LKADISQFYGSLYTHAVGWAIDPKLREKSYWKNDKLLGKKLDQALMNMDGKISQGVPIGNDISFLLAEAVLAQVDRSLGLPANRAYRWYDDYEIGFDSLDHAEAGLKKLYKELARFNLRLNSQKTRISRLPEATEEEWRDALVQIGSGRLDDPRQMLKYFDMAFRLRGRFEHSAVLLYALAFLFKLPCPSEAVGRVAQSCITQSLLCEPGAAQKAFSLLSFWRLNGFVLDRELMAATVNQVILRHEASGPSSDVSWALAFSLEQGIELYPRAAGVLSFFEDDVTALQSLDLYQSQGPYGPAGKQCLK